jgi:hypothetical protein
MLALLLLPAGRRVGPGLAAGNSLLDVHRVENGYPLFPFLS